MNLGPQRCLETPPILFLLEYRYQYGTGGDADRDIRNIKKKFDLQDEEIHTAWLLRKYWEQNQINHFNKFNRSQRRRAVETFRDRNLLRLKLNHARRKSYKKTKKNYRNTKNYIHLTLEEHHNFVEEIAGCVANWGFARLFAECIDKFHFDPNTTIDVRTGI